MAKSKLKNLIKLIATCVTAAVFTVIAVIYFVQDNAYAWFAKNSEVNANGMEVAIKVDESIVDGSSSPEYFNFTQKSGSSYTFEKNASKTMGEYSSQNDNVYQVIVKINLKATASSVTINAYTTAKIYLGADGANQLTSSGNSLSSVVAFEIYYSDGTEVDTVSTDTLKLTPPATVTEYSFVENKKLNSSVPLGETHPLESASKAVYIVIKYNVNAITEVFGNNIGNNVCNTAVTFSDCDFSFSVS